MSDSNASLAIDARNGIARLDMPLGLASFARSRRPGAARAAFVCNQSWVDGVVSIRGMSPDDHSLGVLLAVLVLAERQLDPVLVPSRAVAGLIPPGEDVVDNGALDLSSVTFTCSYADILRLLGVASRNSTNCHAVWESLKNLSTIIVERRTSKYGRALSHLIGSSHTDGRSLRISLSYRLTRCILGQGSYGAVDLRIFRALPRGTARILYTWLASWFGGAYGDRSVGLDRLVERAFGDCVRVSSVSMRDRRHAVRCALLSLSSASSDWSFSVQGSIVLVTRFALLLPRPQPSVALLVRAGIDSREKVRVTPYDSLSNRNKVA